MNQTSLEWEILVTYTHDDLIQMQVDATEQTISVNSIFDDKLVDIRFRNNATHPNRRCYFNQITLYGTPFIKATSLSPTIYPTNVPSISPSISPISPTQSPTQPPTLSNQPTKAPTQKTPNPTLYPSYIPTFDPTLYPSKNPTSIPSKTPTYIVINTTLNTTTTESNIKLPINYIDDIDFQFLTESKVFYVIIGAAGGCLYNILILLMVLFYYKSTIYTDNNAPNKATNNQINDKNTPKDVEIPKQDTQKSKNKLIASKNPNMNDNARTVEGNVTNDNTSEYIGNNNDNDIEIITKDDKPFHKNETQYF